MAGEKQERLLQEEGAAFLRAWSWGCGGGEIECDWEQQGWGMESWSGAGREAGEASGHTKVCACDDTHSHVIILSYTQLRTHMGKNTETLLKHLTSACVCTAPRAHAHAVTPNSLQNELPPEPSVYSLSSFISLEHATSGSSSGSTLLQPPPSSQP